METLSSDLIIIGAGPSALFAAFYAGMRQLSVNIIDSLPELGGQPKALYPDKIIYDIPAYPEISGAELIDRLSQQLARFHATTQFSLNQEVFNLENDNEEFVVETSRATYRAKAVIIAAGNGSFSPRKVDLDQLDHYENRGVAYFVSNYTAYAGKNVAICGGGDSALDTALALSDYAKEIYLIHRRDRFRAHEYSVEAARQKDNINFITPYVPTGLEGDGINLSAIHLQKARSDEGQRIPVDQVIMAYGFTSSLGEIKNWGLDIEKNKVLVDGHCQTNRPGIFAIGDIAGYPGKSDLIVSGFGEAPTAINAAYHYIYPEKRISPLHSSDLLKEDKTK